jgi:hypothetical protein
MNLTPRDSLELRHHRDGGGRREIPWDRPCDGLNAAQKQQLARAWAHRARQEHLAVGAFSMLALELLEVGAESVVLALLTRAAADEVRHADTCRRLAERFGGQPTPAFRGVPSIPKHARPSREIALLHVVEMCCLGETFTGVYLTEMLERTRDATARAAVESLLEDEIDHGRVGWAYLSSICRDGWAQPIVAEALPQLLERTALDVLDAAARRPDVDDADLEAHAFLGRSASARVYREALFEVVLPGFAALDIDLTATEAYLAARLPLACGMSEYVTLA